jgi:lipoate-protein ligase A
MIPARFIDLGVLDPGSFHATYAGVALALADGASPVILWGRARAHISLGQSQAADVELAPDIDVPVVRRPLGGGAVWIDERQHCHVLVVPLSLAPRRPADWYDWGLRPAVATYRRFGIAVVRVEEDLWLDGRKIAGSGAATLGACAVLASSFLIRFPAGRFARCMRSPSATYREWLAAGLAATMTDWESHQRPPRPAVLRRAYCDALRSELGWQPCFSKLRKSERAMRRVAHEDMMEPVLAPGRVHVQEGIKLNVRSFLIESSRGGDLERILKVGGTVVRRERVLAQRA